MRNDSETETNLDIDSDLPLWIRLSRIISPTIKKMVADNKVLRKSSRSGKTEDVTDTPVNNVVSGVEENEDNEGSVSAQTAETTDSETRESEAEQYLIKHGVDSPTREQIKALLAKELILEYRNIGRNNSFIDTDFSLGNVLVTINTEHIFYNEFISKMPEDSKLAFELFIASLAKAIDLTNVNNSDQNDELMENWDNRLKKYLRQIKSD